MWPFDKPRNEMVPMHQPIEKMMTAEEALLARLIQTEARVQGLEQCVIMLSEAFKQLAENQNYNFQAIQKQFLALVKYVSQPRGSILPGENRQDKN